MKGSSTLLLLVFIGYVYAQQCTLETKLCDCKANQACIDGQCAACTDNSQCGENICVSGKCVHKNLLPNVNWRDIVGSICFAFGGAAAAAGGIGGGGIFVPLLIILLDFEPHDAVPISSGLIFAGSITAFVWNARKRHPFADRPLIDIKTVLYLEPATLAGTTVGIVTNTVMPPIVLVIFVTLFLVMTSIRTLKTGIRAWRGETASKKLKEGLINEEDRVEVREEDDEIEMESTPLGHMIESDRHFKTRLFLALVTIWCGFMAINLFKGDGFGDVPSCGTAYWVLFSLLFVFVLLVCVFIYRYLRRDHRIKEQIGYNFLVGDIAWRASTAIKYPFGFFVAGFVAGFAGIGGGMVIGPLLLELGLVPQVAAATSYTFVLFTSSATTAQFLIMGNLRYDYAIWFGIVCSIFVIVGQFGIQKIVKKYDRQSLIIFIVFAILVIATGMLAGRGVSDIEAGTRCGNLPGFRPLC